MTQKDSFIFYRSFFEATKPLPSEEKAALYEAIAEYALNQKQIELSPLAFAMFGLIKPQLEANHRKYENGKKGGKHGNLGGRPKKEKPLENPIGDIFENPKITPNDNVNVNDNVNNNDSLKTIPVSELKKKKKNEYSEEFEEFWKIYPTNGASKFESNKSWNKAIKENQNGTINARIITEGARSYRQHLERTGGWNFTKHATTWLNQRCWETRYAELGRDTQQHGSVNQGAPKGGKTGAAFDALQRYYDWVDSEGGQVKPDLIEERPAQQAENGGDTLPMLFDTGIVR